MLHGIDTAIYLKSKHLFLFLTLNVFIWTTNSQENTDDINALYSKMYSHMYSNKDSTYFYADKIAAIGKKNNDLSYTLYAYTFSNKSAIYFNDLVQLKNNLETLNNIINNKKTIIDTIENIHYIRNSIYYDKATYDYKLNDYQSAYKNLKTIIDGTEQLPASLINKADEDLVYASYTIMAKMYSNDGKYDLARQYYNKTIRFIKITDPENNKKLNRIYSLIGEVFKRENNYKASNNYYIKSLNYSVKNNGDNNSVVTEANNIVENYLDLAQIDSASYYLDIIKPHIEKDSPYSFLFYKSRAKINLSKKNISEAIEDYNKALEITKAKWLNKKHFEIAEVYKEIAKLYESETNFNEALKQIDLAINQVSGLDIVHSSINKTVLLKLLKEKSSLLNKSKAYTKTIKNVEKAIAVLDSLKPTFKNNTDKLFLMDDAFPVFESGLEALFHIYDKTNNETLIDSAFYYTEKSKSVLLLEALLNTKATEYTNIPKEILENEQLLKAEITYLEKQMNNSKSSVLEDHLFEAKSKYRNFIEDLETNYTNYYNLKYNSNVISLSEIQEHLKPDDALISYFYGSKFLYAITITNNNKQFKRIPIARDLEKTLINYQKEISNPKSDLVIVSEQALKIYKILLEPSLETISAENLIIIPDGLLNYIPFESLITSENNYLIENYAVSYTNSATLLSQLKDKKENNHQILAFAPTFNGVSNTFLPLPNNEKEAKSTLTHFKGQLFLNTEASLQNFNTTSPNYSIIHLATHAIFNDETPEFSFLAFTPNTENESLLYVKDLYNLKLNADLVTLSACESGIGDLKRGEGLMSLARGFYFSGASSISSTLWKINDASATKLMDDFYLNLSEGLPKQKALQLAKLNFINKNRDNALSHPYYWSGFIISGNTDAIVSNHQWVWYVLGALTLALLIFIIRKKDTLI